MDPGSEISRKLTLVLTFTWSGRGAGVAGAAAFAIGRSACRLYNKINLPLPTCSLNFIWKLAKPTQDMQKYVICVNIRAGHATML